MLIRCVVDDEINDKLDACGMQRSKEVVKVLLGAVARVDFYAKRSI